MAHYDDGIYLTLLPVCECGEVVRDAYACESISNAESGYKYRKLYISPICCPSCGRIINGFHIDERYLDMFGR